MPEPVYDDGSETEIECESEDLPRSGQWSDTEEALHNPTPEELELGDFLGKMIDVHNDESTGVEWAGLSTEEIESLR